MKNKGFWTYHK